MRGVSSPHLFEDKKDCADYHQNSTNVSSEDEENNAKDKKHNPILFKFPWKLDETRGSERDQGYNDYNDTKDDFEAPTPEYWNNAPTDTGDEHEDTENQ